MVSGERRSARVRCQIGEFLKRREWQSISHRFANSLPSGQSSIESTGITKLTAALVTLYAKAKKANLTRAEENELRKISAEIRRSLGTGKS